MTSFMTTLMSVAFSESLNPLGDGPNFVRSESLKSRLSKVVRKRTQHVFYHVFNLCRTFPRF